jgi:hypothetical protein
MRAAEVREALGLLGRVPERRREALVLKLKLIGLKYTEMRRCWASATPE